MKQDTIRLGNFDFVCTALSARVGMRVAAKLANALAPAVKEAPLDGVPSEDDIGAMLAPILGNPELSATLDFLIDTFAANTIVKNPAQDESGGTPLPRVFDVQFADAYDDLCAWLLFSIKLSLASFFRGARSLGVLLRAQAKASKSPSSAEETGLSGG